MRHFLYTLHPLSWLHLAVLPILIAACVEREGLKNSTDAETMQQIEGKVIQQAEELRVYKWSKIQPPVYDWKDGGAFAGNLFVDVAFDPAGVTIKGEQIRFYVAPSYPPTPAGGGSPHNYRSEIHTMPWEIRHPLGTEQWMGWRYTFGENYVIDPTSPITIFQNHPGIRGESPQFELEIAALDDPRPAIGGEIQIVNAANGDRIVTPVKPEAGETLDVVIHVVYGEGSKGAMQVWLNGELYYDEAVSTVYTPYPFGGNNKWGVYHHTFNDSPTDVEASIAAGSGIVELFMGPLRMITRSTDSPHYLKNAFDLVRPDQ